MYYNGVQFHFSMKIDVNELTKEFSPEQITAIMEGMAKCLAAEHQMQPTDGMRPANEPLSNHVDDTAKPGDSKPTISG